MKAGWWHSKAVGNVAVLVLLLLAGYFFAVRHARFFLVPSASMEPGLLIGDQLVTMRQKVYHRGDIVVVWDAELRENIVKRIAGLPDDILMIAGGALFINDEFASEPYIAEPMVYTLGDKVKIPEGRVYLLGDNRNDSDDSSEDGRTYPLTDILGKVFFRYYPYDRFGTVSSYPLTNVLGE